MTSSIFFARENNLTCVRELQRLKRKQRQRISHRVATMKKLSSFTTLRVGNPKRPWPRELRNERPLRLEPRLTNERHLSAVWRPHRASVTVRRRREIHDLLRRQLEHRDKRMVLAVRAKGDPLSVRGPARREIGRASCRERGG